MVPVCLICLAAAIPVALRVLHPAEPDLFDLTPKSPNLDGYALIGWYDLERGHRALKAGGPFAGSPARVLGYMMAADQHIPAGERVRHFLLAPDTESVAHLIPRFGDRIIDVRLDEESTVPFADGSLVWAWGTWTPVAGDPNREKPLYELRNARVEAASKADIAKYFR
jgi:hypothetical protein